MFDHDYDKYPELTNTELQEQGFTSPFPQITEDFSASVVKVHDGDTITLRTDFRDFDFPLRFLDINAPELSEPGGRESQQWLEGQILDQEVQIMLNQQDRVDKYGRLLGWVIYQGMNMGEIEVMQGRATPFDNRNEGKIPVFDKLMAEGEL
jgi:endonuclease YncB( thermonuclease family)